MIEWFAAVFLAIGIMLGVAHAPPPKKPPEREVIYRLPGDTREPIDQPASP